jgi:hypothetical protein
MRSPDLRFGLIFFVTSVLVKLPYLGTFLTIDERRWINGAGQFLLALRSGDLAQTYWHFFPGITITWGEAIILWLQSLWATNYTLEEFVRFQTENLNLSVGAMRLSGVLLTSVALPFVYALAKPLLGKWPAILGVGLIAVDPFWVAHSRIVNGDALAAILMLASLLSFALLLIKPDQKLAIIAGVFVGLSFLTKLPSQILAPFISLLALIGYVNDRNWRFWLKALILCGLTSILVFVALWPSMWVAPIKTLMMMFEDIFNVGDIGGKDKVEFFVGTVRAEQSRFFYPLALLFRLTPVNLIGSILALVPLFRSNNGKLKRSTVLLWLFILSVIVLANMSPKKADRYAMSVIVTVDLLAGIGWIWLIQKVTVMRQTKAKFIIPTLLVTGQFIFVLLSYPYILTYYNPLLGGFAKATESVPVGRGEGLEQAAAWINSQPGGQLATTSPYYENVTNYYLAGKSLDWPKDGKKQVLADYVVFYITQTQRQLPYPGMVNYFQKQTPAHVVRHGQTPYVWVYKRQRPINALAGEAEIAGRAQIVGFYQSEENLTPGGSTKIILYLLTKDQYLPDNENFQVSLVDALGNKHGVWQNAADNQWILNTIIEWKGELSLPANLAPDDYRLRVSLIDTNINSEVAFFRFEEEIVTVQP